MEQEILDISSRVTSLFNGFKEAAQSQTASNRATIGGLKRNGRFYSAEILASLIKAVAGAFGRLSYKEDQRKKPRFSTSRFKTLYTDFFVYQYYAGLVTDAEQMINLTTMLEQILGILTTFEKGGKLNG
jgi:hypothetical protein